MAALKELPKNLMIAVTCLGLLAACGALTTGCAATDDLIEFAPDPPPADRPEVKPQKPGVRYVWKPGHWAWRAGARRYVWSPGEWGRLRHPHHHAWVKGHWEQTGRGYKWIAGHWR